jgi:YYY domain-containing protein
MTDKRTWWSNPRLWLIAIVVFAAASRLAHIEWDQNHFFHPDERAVVSAVQRLSFRPLRWNPQFFAYGSLPIYLTRIASNVVSLVDPHAATYDGIIVTGRRLSAIIGTLTVVLLVLLGRRLYDRSTGMLAGFLLAACVLHIQNSRFLTVDVPLTFFVLLALYQLVRLSAEGRTSQYVYAGAAIGLATATKFSAMPLFLPLGVAVLHRYVAERRLLAVSGRTILALLAAVAAFALAEPYALIDFKAFYHDILEQSNMVRHAGLFPYTTQYMHTVKYGYDLTQLVLWGMAPPLGVVAVWASLTRIGAAWRARRAEEWVLLSWVVPFFLITGWFEVKFPRYLLPIYPPMILWAAEWLVRKYRQGTFFGRLAAPVVSVGTLAAACAFMSLYTRPHSVVTASEWVYQHIPPGSKILSQDWDEGFPFSLPGREAGRYKVTMFGYYEPDTPSKIQRLSRELAQADYIALQTKRLYGAVTRAPERFPLTTNYFYELFAGDLGYTLIQEIASRPSLFGVQIPDELADESLSVYDHPKVLIFRNTEHLPATVLADKILHGLPSVPLTRNDLLLAHPHGGESWEASGTQPPIQSGMLALILFAALLEALSLSVYPVLRIWLNGAGTFALSKPLGVLLFAYVSWVVISFGAATFTQGTLAAVALAFIAIGMLAWRRGRPSVPLSGVEIRITESLFWGVFALFLLVRAYNPEIYWGEKPMDFSFLNTLTRATTLPPPEPWFAGSPLYYSYFGYYTVAALGKTLHVHPALTFNLGIGLIAGLTAVAAFAVGAAITKQWQTGVLAAFLATLVGNLAGVRELYSRRVVNFDYFWATSRVIKDTINEYPLWSFLFADLHAHVMVMPISLTFVCLTVLWVRSRVMERSEPRASGSFAVLFFLLCLTLGAIVVTNTWSLPTYILFFFFVLGAVWLTESEHRGPFGFLFGALGRVILPSAAVVAGAYVLFFPYWAHFVAPERNFGWERGTLAIPGDFLTIFGLYLFVLVPFLYALWARGLRRDDGSLGRARVALLWLAVALPLAGLLTNHVPLSAAWKVTTRALLAVLFLLALQVLLSRRTESRWRIPVAMAAFAFAVTAGCDLVYVWDRMNTIFKFYLESWFLLSIASAVAAQALWTNAVPLPGLRRIWQATFVGLVAVAMFTAGTAAYGVIHTNRVPTPKPTLDGMAYLRNKAPDELAAYEWLNEHIQGIPTIVEAHGDSYQEFTRVSMNTGLPTVLGWGYHVFQRAHTWGEINRRKADIQTLYTSDSKDTVRAILDRYRIALVFVGGLERRTYAGANLERFKEWTDLLTPVYQNPGVTVFAVNGRFAGTMPVTTIEELPRVAGAEEAPAPQDAPGKLHEPRGLAVTSDGHILVCDFGNYRIQEFGSDLGFVRKWGTQGESPGQFKQPCAVAVGPNDEIFVADTWNHRVQVFSKTGDYRSEFGSSFFGPRGIAIDAKGGVFVADTGNNRIVRFSLSGQKELEWGGKGSEPGKFWGPMGLATDGAGKVYVCDNNNGRLQIFTRDGQFLSAFPVPGWENKVYSEPHVAVDKKGTIWVTVPGAKEVRAYDNSGKLLHTITGQSVPGAAFDTPMGIGLSPTGKEIIVTDLAHRLVRIPNPEP